MELGFIPGAFYCHTIQKSLSILSAKTKFQRTLGQSKTSKCGSKGQREPIRKRGVPTYQNP